VGATKSPCRTKKKATQPLAGKIRFRNIPEKKKAEATSPHLPKKGGEGAKLSAVHKKPEHHSPLSDKRKRASKGLMGEERIRVFLSSAFAYRR